MGTETYGGTCPKCQKAMMQKHESSLSGFMFDACPWCGFADGQLDFGETPTPEYIWNAIFDHHHVKSREELIASMELPESVPVEESLYHPSIFNYAHLVGPHPKTN